MRQDIGEKVLERLATSQKCTLVIDHQPDGKMRVTSGSCDGDKAFLARSGARGAQCRRGGLGVASKPWYDEYAPGTAAADEVVEA